MTELFQQACRAVRDDDAARMGELLRAEPELRKIINEPVGPFDSPAILWARSRPMLDVLLEAGADINVKSRWWAGGFGFLHGAEPDLARYAIERGAVVDVHAAARLCLREELSRLVASDPSAVHARGGDGQTPLHFAGSIEIAQFLLDHGADIDALDVDHESTPAQYMTGGRREIARLLVARGCKSDILLAAALGDLPLVKRHLEADQASIRTRVSEACFPKRDPRSGGIIYIWTLGQEKTAHVVARESGHDAVYEFLMERSPADLKLIAGLKLGAEEVVREVLRGHPDLVRQLPESDSSELAHAAKEQRTEIVRLMLELGWPVNARGQHGGTALHWAAFHGNTDLVRLLLEHGAALDLTDYDFKATPLGWAAHGSEEGWSRDTGDFAGAKAALERASRTNGAAD